ncbi:MAG: 2-amino-4-hydroxy-6-hydroxymethyldihydropteridine diphosphokinase [Brevinematia bacterium]
MSIILSIGTNEGNLKENIRKALCELSDFARIIKISKAYRTEPYGNKLQKRFINLALEVETTLTPLKFLKKCQAIEKKLGRKRLEKWGPRPIDIDIIFWHDIIIDKPELKVPHYDMQNREFVLKPLMDICPDFIHPIFGKPIKILYEELKNKF